jgi:YidC/Oxa1 family membrane protein insertase
MFEGFFSKNFWIATILAISIVFAWDYFILKDYRTQEAEAKKQQEQILQSNLQLQNQKQELQNKDNIQKNRIEIKIDNGKVLGSINLVGAKLDDIKLVNYKETLEQDSDYIKVFNYKNSADAYFFDSGFIVTDSVIELPNNNTIWKANRDSLTQQNPIELTFINKQGVVFKKTISIDSNYVFTIVDTVENKSNIDIQVSPYALILRHNDPQVEDLFISHEGFIGYVNNLLERVKYKDTLTKTHSYTTTGGYIGFSDKYFLSALLLNKNNTVLARFVSFKDNFLVNNYQVDYKGQAVALKSNQIYSNTSSVFVGPKEYNLLDKYNDEYKLGKFEDTIDFGWFFFFTKPMISFLLWIYHAIGNFGISILIFTIIIRAIILPIAYKSYVSMARMKELQPQLKELKEKHKGDLQKYNKELMAVYKKEKVNPFSGCLPLILQIPIFFSIYKVIFISIEMRHAPFFGWINDMASKDPTNLFNLFGLLPFNTPEFMQIGVWPILMGVTMYFQQKLTATQSLDKIQKRVMDLMPIFLTFILANFPVGLVIYWTWSNVISIVQQWTINKIISKKKVVKLASVIDVKAKEKSR